MHFLGMDGPYIEFDVHLFFKLRRCGICAMDMGTMRLTVSHTYVHRKSHRAFRQAMIDKIWLRPAGGVKHSDSDLVETRMLSAKKALHWIESSILSNSRKF